MNSTKTYCELKDNIQHILVALDDTASSGRAVDYVSNFLAGNSQVNITLLHVSSPEEWQESPAVVADSQAQGEAILAMEQKLINYKKRMIAAGLAKDNINILMVEHEDGNITEGILAQQRALRACTIVVGHRHVSKKEEILFGSIANRLSHKAEHCAVWIIE